MKSLVMKSLPFQSALRPEMVVDRMGAAIGNVAERPLNLTYSIYYYVKYVKRLVDVKEKCLEVLPRQHAFDLKSLAECDLPKKDPEYWLDLQSREQERFSQEERKSREGLADIRKALSGSEHIKMIQVDGVEPTETTISSREYPFTAEVFVVIRSNEPQDSPASRLRDWLLTSAGQKVVAESGYVPVGVHAPAKIEAPDLIADNVAQSSGNNQWNWTVFLKGEPNKIDAIKCVEYTLHPTFPNPVRLICERGDAGRPFGVSATGWGTFQIGIRVFMKDGTRKEMKHQLKF